MHPAKSAFIEAQCRFFAVPCCYRIEFVLHSAFCVLEFFQKLRADGKQITPRQTDNLVDIPKAGSHHLRLVAEFLVLVVDASDGCNAWILVGNYFCSTLLLLVPVINPAYERGNESDARLGASCSLRKAE